MDNREEILDALNDFSRKQPKEIPAILEQFLKQVAKTGETLFPWTLLKALFVTKLEQVMNEFNEECINDEVPPCPNVENARFEVYRSRIMEAVHKFHGAPFTIQRLCELLTDPKRHYKRCDKFMRGLEKNVLVVSTVDPFGRKVVSESKNLVNGMDSNSGGEDSASAPPPTTSSISTPPTPPVPTWSSPSSSISPTTTWPTVQADLITPSTAPLLEVCDLPDPKEPATAATIPTETAAVNGHHEEALAGSMDDTAEPSSSTEVVSETTPSALDQPMVTSTEETVDSSGQMAVEEMVGEEEEAATSTAIVAQEEEAVGDTPAVVSEVIKETASTTDPASEDTDTVTADTLPAPSGDWLSEKLLEHEPNTAISQEEDSGTESQNNHTDSSDASLIDTSSELQDSSYTISGDGSESKASSSGQEEALGSAADTTDVEASAVKTAADSSTQPECDCSEKKASVVEEGAGNEAETDGDKGEENDGANKVEGGEESIVKDDDDDDADGGEAGKDAEATKLVTSDTAVTDTSLSSSVSSCAEDCVLSGIVVPSSDSADMTAASSEASSSQNVSQSACPSAVSDTEAANTVVSSASDADIPAAKRRKTEDESSTATSSPSAPEAACEEVRLEAADSNTAVSMETDNIDSSNSVPAAIESSQAEATAGGSEIQPEAPSTDDSSQAEPMEQD